MSYACGFNKESSKLAHSQPPAESKEGDALQQHSSQLGLMISGVSLPQNDVL